MEHRPSIYGPWVEGSWLQSSWVEAVGFKGLGFRGLGFRSSVQPKLHDCNPRYDLEAPGNSETWLWLDQATPF